MKKINSEFNRKDIVKATNNIDDIYQIILDESHQVKSNRIYKVVEIEYDNETSNYLYTLRDVATNILIGSVVSEFEIEAV